MAVKLQRNPHMQALADEHRSWLSAFDPQYLVNWEKLLNADDEAAMTEAAVRRMLQRFAVTVEPNEDLVGRQQRPDFGCQSASYKFYVEVTHISIEKATTETGMPDEPTGFSPFSPLNDAFFRACTGKAEQCSHANAPVLLAIGTWHGLAAMTTITRPMVNMLLTGQSKIAWTIDVATRQQLGDTFQTTEFYSAAFLKRDKTDNVGYARSSISGLLLIGVGFHRPKVLGVLHPNPARAFDPHVLPGIEFAAVQVDLGSGQLHVSWAGGSDERWAARN